MSSGERLSLKILYWPFSMSARPMFALRTSSLPANFSSMNSNALAESYRAPL